jgi:hypothetical protein
MGRRRRSLRSARALAGFVATALLVGFMPVQAGAGMIIPANGGTTADCANNNPGTLVAADDWAHTVYLNNLTSYMNAESQYALDYAYNVNDPDVTYVGSVDAFTDVVAYNQYYTTYCGVPWNSVAGMTTCVSRNSVNECEKHEVRYDLNDMAGGTQTFRRNEACHEMGHSFGLVHSDSGCMYGFPSSATWLSGSDVLALNAWFDPPNACCDKQLNGDQSLTSPDGRWKLVMQGDGNLVGYARSQSDGGISGAFWASGTSGQYGATAIMQGDGNLVIYNNGSAIWASGTGGSYGAKVVMQSDRNIVIYNTSGSYIWYSGTCCA